MKLQWKDFVKTKDSLRTQLRGANPFLIENVTKIIRGFEYLFTENKELQAKVSSLNQLSLMDTIDNPPQPYVAPVKEEWKGASLIERIVGYVDRHLTGSEEYKRLLRYNNLTHEKALAMYEDWKKENNK